MKSIITLFVLVLLGCSASAEVGEKIKSLNEAKAVLLDFKRQDREALEVALEILHVHETPQRFEEWGILDGQRYFYSRDTFEGTGIIVHRYDYVITLVEER